MASPSSITLKPDVASGSARSMVRWFYRFCSGIVALLVGVLPLVYLILLTATTALVLWHAAQTLQAVNFGEPFGPEEIRRLAFILLEGLAAALLIRQVITPKEPQCSWLELHCSEQANFFVCLDVIAREIGAPSPERVIIDCRATMRAEYKNWWDMMLGRRLQLRLGMTLPVGLTSQEFVAMVAHELAYYSSGSGVMSAHFIRSVHHWFLQRIRHDPWLEWLREGAANTRGRATRRWLCEIGAFLVWLSLQPLRLLYSLCWIISSASMSRMVYEADGVAARLAGSSALITAIQKRGLTYRQWHVEHDRIQNYVNRLPDNIPLLIVRSLLGKSLPDDYLNESHHWQSLAPTDGQRMKGAEWSKHPGMIETSGDSTEWFRNFHEAARRVTYFHYQNDWGITVNQHSLVAIEEIVHEKRNTTEIMAVLNRYFRGLAHPERAFCGIAEEQPTLREPEILRLELLDCREWLSVYTERMASALADWTRAWQLVRDLEMAYLMTSAGLPVQRGQFGHRDLSANEFKDEIAKHRGIMDNMEGSLRHYEGRMESRLSAALELLWRTKSKELPPKLLEARQGLPKWVLVYEALGLHLPILRELMTHFHAFQSLGSQVSGRVDSAAYLTTIQRHIPLLIELTTQILQPLAQWPYPFAADGQNARICDYISPEGMRPGALSLQQYQPMGLRDGTQAAGKHLATIIGPLIDRYLVLYHQSFVAVTKAADVSEWHFLDPFHASFVPEAQKVHQSVRHVEAPTRPLEDQCDPELMYAGGAI
jgi:hypothetical protein